MDAKQTGKPEANEILANAPRAVLVSGPASAGKSRLVRDLARLTTDAIGRCGCLILAPNYPAAEDIRNRMLEESDRQAIVAPPVMTFSQLAGQILSRQADPPLALSALQRHVLLQDLVDSLLAEGKLARLAASARTPGFVGAMGRSIAELKRAAIAPEALAGVLGQAGPAGVELLTIYQAYQQALLAGNLVDTEGRMWLARDELLNRDQAGLALLDMDLRCIAVDGFSTFSPTQLEILQLLSGAIQPVVITLCCSSEDRRGKMWQWTRRTRDALLATFGDQIQQVQLPPRPAPLGPVWERIFDPLAQPMHLVQGVAFIEAPDPEAEYRQVARRVKRLLLDGAPAGSIAILARNLTPHLPLLDDILVEHEIPVASRPIKLTDVPIVRFVLRVAQLAPELAGADVLAVIRSSYFLPDALGPFGPADVAVAEMLIREGNVLGGAEAYQQAADLVWQRLASARPETETDLPATVRLGALHVDAAATGRAVDMLSALFELARRAVEGDLQTVVEALQLARAAVDPDAPARTARDLQSLEALRSACRWISPDTPIADRVECLAQVQLPGPGGAAMVDVLDLLDARSLRYEHVFLIGCNDGLLPQSPPARPIITEAQRADWVRRGVVLDSREDLTGQEMLLMYQAVSRADSRLTVSYSMGECGPASASPYLLALAETLGGINSNTVGSNTTQIPAGQFLPPACELASRREARIAAVAGLFQPHHDPQHKALGWLAGSQQRHIDQVSRGLWARYRRWLPGPCDSFDGRISQPDLLAELGRRFPHKTVFSASQLNRFVQCPWQFFAQYVLKLNPLPEAQRLLEPVHRGLFCHDVLFRVFAALRDQANGPIALDQMDWETVESTLDSAVQAASQAFLQQGCPYPVLWEIQKSQLHADLAEYLRKEAADSSLQPTHLHFELAFGLDSPDALAASDPASQAQPVQIATSAGPVRLRGKIDRIDRVTFDGVDALAVVDYKTGAGPGSTDVFLGQDLQIPLYAAAVQQIFGETIFGGSIHQVLKGAKRWFAPFQTFRKKAPDWQGLNERFEQTIQRLGDAVERMAGGRFDLFDGDSCSSFCPFSQICQHSPARRDIKARAGSGKNQEADDAQ